MQIKEAWLGLFSGNSSKEPNKRTYTIYNFYALNDLKQPQMTSNDLKWPQMPSDGFKTTFNDLKKDLKRP